MSRNSHGTVAALVPARGGSKGIPRKNVIAVAGKPLIAWTIEAALRSSVLDRVVVSTDDEEIARVSKEWGAEVPFYRPAELSRDDSPSIAAVNHAIRWLEENQNYAPLQHENSCNHSLEIRLRRCLPFAYPKSPPKQRNEKS